MDEDNVTVDETTDADDDLPKSIFWAGIVRMSASAIFVWLNLWAFVFVILGSLIYSPVLVISGSMEPFIRAGDIVLNNEPEPDMLYEGPTVVTFEQNGRLVTHRVVSADEDAGVMFTRGDANPVQDSSALQPERVQGVARWLIPFAGLPQLWFSNGQIHYVTLWAIALSVSAWWAFPSVQKNDDEPDEKPGVDETGPVE